MSASVKSATTGYNAGLAHPLPAFGATAKAFMAAHPLVLPFVGGMVVGIIIYSQISSKKTTS